MASVTEAERVSVNPATADGQPGQRIVGYWIDLAEAAAALGCSDRTLRRKVAAGSIPNRMHKGRRQVRLDTADLTDMADTATVTRTDNPDTAGRADPDRFGADKVSESVAGTLATMERVERDLAGVLAVLADDLRGERTLAVERVEVELRRVRRRSGWAWGLAGVLAVLGAAGAVLGVRAVAEARIEAAGLTAALDAAEGQRAVLADQLADTTARADRATTDLTDTTAALFAARLREVEAELARVRAEAQLDDLAEVAPGVLTVAPR